MAQERGLKNRKPLSNAIKKELWLALDELSKATRVNKSKLLDEAVEDLLLKHKQQDLINKYKTETK